MSLINRYNETAENRYECAAALLQFNYLYTYG